MNRGRYYHSLTILSSKWQKLKALAILRSTELRPSRGGGGGWGWGVPVPLKKMACSPVPLKSKICFLMFPVICFYIEFSSDIRTKLPAPVVRHTSCAFNSFGAAHERVMKFYMSNVDFSSRMQWTKGK